MKKIFAVANDPGLDGRHLADRDLTPRPKALNQLSIIDGTKPEGAVGQGKPLLSSPGQVRVDGADEVRDLHGNGYDGQSPICKEGNRPFHRHFGFGPWSVAMDTLSTIKRRVRERLDATGIDMKTASVESGHGETFVRDLLKRDREPSASKLQDLARVLGVTLAYLTGETDVADAEPGASDLITVNEYDVRLSAGGGALLDTENVIGSWRLPRSYLSGELRLNPSALAVVEVEGDSMSPTLWSGDRVIVDHSDRNPNKPGVYAVWDSNATVVKRIEKVPLSDPPQIVLISDNKNHNQYTVPAELVNIIGRVVWYARRL